MNFPEKAWKGILERSIESPEFPARIRETLQNPVLNLFSPWGPKYSYKERGIRVGEAEIQTLKEINTFLSFLSQQGYQTNYFLLFADSYGTEINGLPSSVVKDYFRNLQEYVQENFSWPVRYWSELRKNPRYLELKGEVSARFGEYVPSEVFSENLETAKKFSGSMNSAREYSIERVVEGLLIEEEYSPLKISLVKKEKDTLDGPLKRIYVINSRKPWMR